MGAWHITDAKGTQLGLFLQDPPQMDPHPWTCRWKALAAHLHPTPSRRTCGWQEPGLGLSVPAARPLSSSWCICAFCSNISSSRSRAGWGGQQAHARPPAHRPIPGPYPPTAQRPAPDGAEGRCSEDAQRMCEAEWGTSLVSPESHLPSLGPAAAAAVGRPTRRAAGRSPRAGGNGRLSQARRARDQGQLPAPPARAPREWPPSLRWGLILLPASPRPPGSPPGSPLRLGSLSAPSPLPPRFGPSRDGSPISHPSGLPGKRLLSSHHQGGTLPWGLTPAPSSAGGHAGSCGSGLPRRPARRQSVLPRMRRSLPDCGARGSLCSPFSPPALFPSGTRSPRGLPPPGGGSLCRTSTSSTPGGRHSVLPGAGGGGSHVCSVNE